MALFSSISEVAIDKCVERADLTVSSQELIPDNITPYKICIMILTREYMVRSSEIANQYRIILHLYITSAITNVSLQCFRKPKTYLNPPLVFVIQVKRRNPLC